MRLTVLRIALLSVGAVSLHSPGVRAQDSPMAAPAALEAVWVYDAGG